MDIAGSVVLVTGGASGLGMATAGRLVTAGARVVIADLPSSPGAKVADRLGERATFVPADVTSEEEVTDALDVASGQGGLRVVVNCAGILSAIRTAGRRGPFPLEEFRRVIEVNLVGTFNVIRLAVQRMSGLDEVHGERGVIVNTASVAAFDGQIGQAAYSASKGGIASMTLPIARDLADQKIRVVTVAPGVFDTPMLEKLPERAVKSLESQFQHPARMGIPGEYAALVEHIVSNPMLNGETVRLDGGLRPAAR
ncbi:3-hydroxyacyl-CoA dehydrogenase [Sphaerisporangium flaviroseum]|uniref:3-hydroxyacyl-CoA dehydrogenase n=1 Tax=Sphaerisporangium flaviroseum TaxID=509199 RepID=A0ABP7ID19_9ACTN